MTSRLSKVLRPVTRGQRTAILTNHPYAIGLAALVGAAAISALFNRSRAKKAERDNPPIGMFVTSRGVRLHYVERGEGRPLVLLHGNGSMIQDFDSSGLIDQASKTFRVIAFDRPGHGHSSRPRTTTWSSEAQANLIHAALKQIGVSQAIVFGHSWGTSVAVALALRHPSLVKALVLASGYYFPTARGDVITLAGPAVPVLGDFLRYTVSPLLGRVMWPLLMRKMFGPAEVPEAFKAGFPSEMALRPSQIRASAEESALLIPEAFALRDKYAALTVPVVIVAGEQDRLIDIDAQSARLHHQVTHSTFHPIPRCGHMVHQTAPNSVLAAIAEAAAAIHRGGPAEPHPSPA